ncbi:MAG: dioxygenase [Phycisphaerae bacterium]|nr:dioxygenase [Phycisphaerae bacterium]
MAESIVENEKPFHLRGNFAPVKDELTVTDLKVEGSIPPELCGTYIRNGANPRTGESLHWFLGNGMVHGVRLENGGASWYRNRYVKTPLLDDPDKQRISETGTIDYTVSAANTHVIRQGGRILALEEGAFPYELTPELETVGAHDFEGKLDKAMTAHPKICPETGELIFYSYGQLPPYLLYHRVDAQGKLVQTEEITVGGPTMMHDFQITRNHSIFMDLPVVFNLELALQGTMPFLWDDDYPARIGIMPRAGKNEDVKWFEVEPCYVFHTLNAWEEGNEVIFDVCRISEVWRGTSDMASGDGVQTLHRFTFDMVSGNVKEETLDERGMDFPRVADARIGLKNRYGYTLLFGAGGDGDPAFQGHLKFDMETGRSGIQAYGPGISAGEPVFAAAPGSDPDSDEGWVLSYLYDENQNQSALAIVDAQRWGEDPVALIHLPQRVPFGFHGSYFPDL